MIEIKKLPKERWVDYKNLRLKSLKNDPLAFGSSFEEESEFSETKWKKRITNVLFAIENDKPIGMIVYMFNRKNKSRHIAEIFSVYVKKEFRNKKIGNKLVETALEMIQKNTSISKVKLVVTSVQIPAIKLYSSLGFEIVGKLKNELCVDSKLYDALIMEKTL